MAHKTNLKHKRKKAPPLPGLVDQLIDRSMRGLKTGETKPSIADLIRMVQLQRKLFPEIPEPGSAIWVDEGWTTASGLPRKAPCQNRRNPSAADGWNSTSRCGKRRSAAHSGLHLGRQRGGAGRHSRIPLGGGNPLLIVLAARRHIRTRANVAAALLTGMENDRDYTLTYEDIFGA